MLKIKFITKVNELILVLINVIKFKVPTKFLVLAPAVWFVKVIFVSSLIFTLVVVGITVGLIVGLIVGAATKFLIEQRFITFPSWDRLFFEYIKEWFPKGEHPLIEEKFDLAPKKDSPHIMEDSSKTKKATHSERIDLVSVVVVIFTLSLGVALAITQIVNSS